MKQAATALNADQEVVTTLKVETSKVPIGAFMNLLFTSGRFLGIREHLVLKPIASSEALTPHLNELLERAVG